MNFKQNISLKEYNTFGINAYAKKFISVNSREALKEVIATEQDFLLLGGGSNLLLTSDVHNLVIHLNLKGLKVHDSGKNLVHVTAEAGENWHDFVLWCISQNYGGLENLSLIPGNVGASPIQNIGAYGVELQDTFYQLEALEIATGKIKVFRKRDCLFGYRNSVFKNELKGKYIILNVTFELLKSNHKINTTYGDISSYLQDKKKPTIKDISAAVIAIRKSKLPDPKEIGNSGSFFKNPVIDLKSFKKIQEEFIAIPHHKVAENEIKVPAGWLIEQCGFKGKRFGNAGVHDKQALVLVNYDNATGKEIYNLAERIQQKVKKTFDISLEIEVNVI